MILSFTKMHGAGNDFIFALRSAFPEKISAELIRSLCDRHRGIGGDGLILLKRESDFIRMEYFNSDGSPADLCGNGLRCSASYAFRHGMSDGNKTMKFRSGQNELTAEVLDDHGEKIRIELLQTEEFQRFELPGNEVIFKGGVGVPHAVKVVENPEAVNVREEGHRLRFHEAFAPAGANVDFIAFDRTDSRIVVRTYERGVEDETLACGTGCASVGIAAHQFLGFGEKISILCRGGDQIEIEIMKNGDILKGVFLTGPAVAVFDGTIDTERL